MAGSIRLRVHQLEDRTVPAAPDFPGTATFGVAWSESTRLTVSFAPDGTGIAGEQSRLFATLDAQMPRAQWQGEILRAIQTWAMVANVNVGVVSDGGQPFGEPGLTYGDDRFGDIRIGSRSMASRALGVTVPHDTFGTGTWSGDILFNSTIDFRRPESDLYTVALHEVGHALGLAQSRNAVSAMADHGSQPRTGLAAEDVAAIQALYGARLRDPNEGPGGNDTRATATRADVPDDGELPGVALGDITTPQDVDFFEIRVPDDYNGPLTFRLQTAGVSLLAPRLTILSESGQVLGQAQASEPNGNTLTVQLNQVIGDRSYFARIEAATGAAFTTGRFGLAAIFGSRNTMSIAQVDQFIRGPYDHLDSREIDNVLHYLYNQNGNGLLDDDGFDDDPTGANVLEPIRGNVRVTHFGTVSSLLTPTDVDFYRFVVPSGTAAPMSVLTATVAGLDVIGTVPRLTVLNGNLQPVAAEVLAAGSGTFTVQATGLVAGATYYVQVAANLNAAFPAGNYALSLDLGGRLAVLESFASGIAAPQPAAGQPAPIARTLQVLRPQMYQFLLATNTATEAGRSVAMSIVDATGRVVLSMTVAAGSVASSPVVLLTPGLYSIRVHELGAGQPIAFQLRGKVLTDPIGPAVNDITATPRHVRSAVLESVGVDTTRPVVPPYPWSLLDILI